MYKRTRTSWTKHMDFMALDLLCLHIAFIAAFTIRFPGEGLPYGVEIYRDIIIIMSIILLAVSLALNNLSEILKRNWFLELISVSSLTVLSLLAVSLYLFSTHSAEVYSRLLIYYCFLIFLLLDYTVRMLWKNLVLRLKIPGNSSHFKSATALIVTQTAENAETIIAALMRDAFGFNIKGLVLTEEGSITDVLGIPVVAQLDDAADYVCREWIDEIIIFLPENASQPKAFLEACAEMGVTVHSVINMQNVDRSKQFIEDIGGFTVLTTAYNYVLPYQAFIKRAMDIVGGIIGSFITLILTIIIGPIIYINSPGPIFFKQKRIGKNGRQFWVLKFRSMYLDAEDRKKSLMTENRVSDGMMFKMDFDPRVIGNRVLPDGTKKTGIGEFIRKTSLDEFPQFINVLRGEMTLVGTRPPTVDEWEKYKYHHRARLAIKPGITGMWQVSGRSEITDFEEVVRLDTEYICRYRLMLDIKILLKTIVVLFQRKGAM